MSLVHRAARLQYRFLDRMRHAESFTAGATPGTAPDFGHMRGAHYCLLVTFKRSGEAVPSPVLFGLAGGKLYFRTEPDVGKVKRVRNDAHVRVGPCSYRGKPTGPLVEGSARVLDPGEYEHAYTALRDNYTRLQRLYESAADRLPIELTYVEVTPSAPAA